MVGLRPYLSDIIPENNEPINAPIKAIDTVNYI